MGATTSNTTTEIDIEQLAWDVAADGPVAHHDRLTAVARTARFTGVARVAAGVLADPSAPPVARQRALGIIAIELAVATVAPAARSVA